MAAPAIEPEADSTDEDPPRLCYSDDSECDESTPQTQQPLRAYSGLQPDSHDDNDSMPELVSGESSEEEGPVHVQTDNRFAPLSTVEDPADSDGWTTADEEDVENAHMHEGDEVEDDEDECIEEEEDEDDEGDDVSDPDADSDADECWCPACTTRRLQGFARTVHGRMGPAHVAGLAGMPRQTSPGRGRGRAGQFADGPPPGFMSAAELMMGALQSDEAISSHPLLRQFAPMSDAYSPATAVGKPPIRDLPPQRVRRKTFELQDLLQGAKPPASLEKLLAREGYVRKVLSRLPGVDPESPALQALAGALKMVCTVRSHPC